MPFQIGTPAIMPPLRPLQLELIRGRLAVPPPWMVFQRPSVVADWMPPITGGYSSLEEELLVLSGQQMLGLPVHLVETMYNLQQRRR